MCGFVGYIAANQDSSLEVMAEQIAHRGPDGLGIYHNNDNTVHFCHVRLAITDIVGGIQPMWNEYNTVCVLFNGEIYNHLEIRKELISNGHIFRTDHSDTEVLVHGFEQWGVQLFSKLNGMFSICIYDTRINEIFFARDRFGKKPLYYTANPFLIFGSELSAVLAHPNTNKELSDINIRKYFAYGAVPGNNTIYKDIFKLEPGSWIKFNLSNGGSKKSIYYRYDLSQKDTTIKFEEAAEELERLIIESTKRRLVADRPVGLALSGGLDSSAVLYAINKLGLSSINTFSIGFENSTYDESSYAKKVANYFNAPHYNKLVTIADLESAADFILDNLDEPMGDSSILPTYILSKYASEMVTVCLTGDGADEILYGYAPFKALPAAMCMNSLFGRKFAQLISHAVNRLPLTNSYLSYDEKIKRFVQGVSMKPCLWNPIWLSPLRHDEINALLNCNISIDELYEDAINVWNQSECVNVFDKTSEFYVNFFLKDGVLPKIDRASMLNGMEFRSPFLDNEVVDFCTTLPTSFKVANGITKKLLRKVLDNKLPSDILGRPKHGFGAPISKVVESIYSKTYVNCDKFNKKFLNETFHLHLTKKKDYRMFLWDFLLLERNIKNNLWKN